MYCLSLEKTMSYRHLLWFGDDIDDTLYSHVYWSLSYLPAWYFRRPDDEMDPEILPSLGGYWRSDEVKCQGRARRSREEGYSVFTHLS